MNEQDARHNVETLAGARAARRLDRLAAIVIDENSRQNLIAASTVPAIWARHIWDSVQLLNWMPSGASSWLDIGTGGGFPGLAIACAIKMPIILVEPRRRRAEFLQRTAQALDLDWVSVEARKIETVTVKADVISARAVASSENLLRSAAHCATPSTRWLLPRGRSANSDLTALRIRGSFHVEQSLSEADGRILIVDGVAR